MRESGGRLGRALAAALGIAFAIAPPARAQPQRPSDDTLLALQERGRIIALSIQAAARGAELLKAQDGAPPSNRMVVVPGTGDTGWKILFLQDLEPAGAARPKAPALVAETTFSPDAGQTGTLGLIVPAKIAPAAIQSWARAQEQAETVVSANPEAGAPMVEAAVREKDSTFSVYVVSRRPPDKPADPSAVVVGRDFMVRIAATGRQMISSERLHDSVSTLSLQPRPPGTPLLHEHDKGDLPSPTDVALVLEKPVLAPLLVLTPRWMFRIDDRGTVTWLGPNPNPPRPAASPAAATPGAGSAL